MTPEQTITANERAISINEDQMLQWDGMIRHHADENKDLRIELAKAMEEIRMRPYIHSDPHPYQLCKKCGAAQL